MKASMPCRVVTILSVDLTKQDAIEQLYTFDSIGRDPRGHAVSVVYMVLGLNIGTENSSTTEDPQFFPITKLPKLAYDHDKIIKYAHERLKSKVGYSTVIAALLPKQFTLSQLQSTYEAVLGHELDKRNFRKRFLSFDALIDTNESYREGAHRPAKLYSLNTKLELLSSDLK
jgi:8-oxo-dGTP diphosphatase